MEPNDIVARLREMDADIQKEIDDGEHGPNGVHWVIPFDCLEVAAQEIERLRELFGNAERLRDERDEARREVCQIVSHNDESSKPESAEQVAERREWDCFKEVR